MKKVRVLYVINKMDRGGAETLLMNILRNIDFDKFDVSFLVHDNEKGDYDDEILSYGCKIYYMKPYKVYNYLSYKNAVNEFFSTHKNDFDVVHGHNRSCMSIYLSAAKKNGMYTIAHAHSDDGKSISDFLYKFLIFRIKYIADFFIGCSKLSLYNSFKKTIDDSNAIMIKNGIDCSNYKYDNKTRNKIRGELGIGDKVVIGHVGRFVPVKNHKFLVDVFSDYHEINCNSILVLVGKGPLEEDVRKYVNTKGLDDCVLFLGLRNDVNELLMAFDYMIFPSLYEGLPLTLVEAQCTGLPCLVSNNVSPDVNITDLVTNMSIDLDSKKWAESINISNDINREDYQKQVIASGFDIKSIVKTIEKIYINHKK